MNRFFTAAIVALLVLATFTVASGAPAKTHVVKFDQRRMDVTSSARGDCWTTSIASRRMDAYRCMVVNSIYDPCFVVTAKIVACPSALNPNSGIRVLLTKPLPSAQRAGSPNVWMMELANGVKCNVGTGTVLPNYPYYCTGNWVCGSPQGSSVGGIEVAACGQPVSGTSITARRRFAVTAAYR
jgi:hypothetical protein